MSANLFSSVLGGFRQICLVSNLSTISRTFIATRKSVFTPFKAYSLIVPSRFLAHGVQLTKPMIEDRVMLVLKLYDKVDPDKLTFDSKFREDFGIDSLDHVELVMAIEEEFCFEIPDMDSQHFLTPRDIIQYVCDKYDVYDDIHG
ncbi:Acyl carrier protein [Schistosoma japonicum]|uniref:Acyl carrier protein n=1 Tax=Schistosoma japonicum TaxID=6182 RepID=C1L5E9_SCHJA|nr:Acyl carrier protein [Schistosoma japonicum]CAX69927.1 NADH dehydrogenase (ubiquinone) 1 alpha/beta subcomplex 1 [Schistosoma japonicum]CAX74205.1 NADH dehydrogenase (ubiquinone) 1 alpha/beta subcomplex 1 [Schistosoma japonicum]